MSQSKAKIEGRFDRYLGKLHQVLSEAFPTRLTAQHRVLDVVWLAQKLGMTKQGVYRWLKEDSIPYLQAMRILSIKGCQITIEDLQKHDLIH